jgi:hypothetical protein
LDDALKEVLDAKQEVDARLNASMKLREELTMGAKIVSYFLSYPHILSF